LINKYRGQLDAIVAPTVVALPKVAEAVERAGLSGKIVVTGMATPNQMKEFVKRGTVKTVVLWNPVDLGYLAVYAAQASLAGTLGDNATQARCRQDDWARATQSYRSTTSRPRGRSH
jgi:rhamnose transport system substrate-binding protein